MNAYLTSFFFWYFQFTFISTDGSLYPATTTKLISLYELTSFSPTRKLCIELCKMKNKVNIHFVPKNDGNRTQFSDKMITLAIHSLTQMEGVSATLLFGSHQKFEVFQRPLTLRFCWMHRDCTIIHWRSARQCEAPKQSFYYLCICLYLI